ncbi:hypothetical protein [Herminiimonas sp.]|uniref:hypothetical protein n=1 Tax=Herminiimonas sp. TaxID=1926289 RepID=UPI0027202B93|nr:hypothetical protein [Herminiimonas sp.]MDO8304860.1 hypothetical protein [Herminiimonas sp.]
MMQGLFAVTLIAALTCSSGSVAAATKAPVATPTAATPEAPAVAVSPAAPAIPALFLKPVLLRGTLGDVNVQVQIRPKAEIDEGIEGEYFIFGNTAQILLAGEIEGDILFMEESENGTNISGQWDGKLEGDILAGSWMSADGSFTKPFSLKVVPLKPATPARNGKKAAAKAGKP